MSGVSVYPSPVLSWNPVIAVETAVDPISPPLMTVRIPWLVIPAPPPKPPNVAAVLRFGAMVTVNCAVPAVSVTGSVAVIVMGPPALNAVANPLKPAALSIVATVETSGVVVQVTSAVIILVVASVYVPVATYC